MVDKKADMEKDFKAKDQADTKKCPDLEEEESKDANVYMMMQPQDYVIQVAEASNQAKIDQISEACEQELAGIKKKF